MTLCVCFHSLSNGAPAIVHPNDPLTVPRLIVIGGGVDGAAYVRQLLRAHAAARLETGAIVVVDRDPACRASAFASPLVRVEVAEWDAWLAAHLGRAGPGDHLVPYHWAPHLLLGWLEGELRAAGGRVLRVLEVAPVGVPFEMATSSGRALSYATWTCPVFCIEPALCPHTRGPRDWSLAGDLLRPPAAGVETVVFQCLHLVYGVGTIPVAAIHAARERMRASLGHGPRTWRVATSSHCHALAAMLHVE